MALRKNKSNLVSVDMVINSIGGECPILYYHNDHNKVNNILYKAFNDLDQNECDVMALCCVSLHKFYLENRK